MNHANENFFSYRLKKIREERKLTQTELATLLGYKNYTTVSKWESGDSLPRGKDLKRLAEYFGVTTDYLLGLDDFSNLQPVTKLVKIPILGEIACGVPLLAEQNIEGYREEIADILPTGEVFFLKAKGDSMFPTIPDKSFVLIRRQESVEDGEIAAVMVNGDTEATLKRVKHQGDMILLMPDNNEYPPYVVNKDNDAKIIGKAIKLSVDL